MARPKTPTIPDDKLWFYKEQLYRELAQMFKWEGLPTEVPVDYLERNLVRYGYVLFYYDDLIGHDVLRAEVTGYNRHGFPVQARTFTPNTNNENTTIYRNLKRLSDGQTAADNFDKEKDGVLIMNMATWEGKGQPMGQIVNHFAERLALSQQAIDTNLLWANIPYIFQTGSDETRLSIERMFSSVYTGEPFIITDKSLFTDNKDRAGIPTGITFIGKELMDMQNEIMMKFREMVGFNTAGVDKAERVNTLEVQSNDQYTQTVRDIMLQQRTLAADSINKFFGVNVTVSINEPEQPTQQPTEGGNDNGNGDSGIGATSGQN
jgi:hypothetical protein